MKISRKPARKSEKKRKKYGAQETSEDIRKKGSIDERK